MNFQVEAGYGVAVRILRSLGVPIQDKNPVVHGSQGQASRPVSPQHQQMLPMYSMNSEATQMKTDPTRGPFGSFGSPLHDTAAFGSQGFPSNPASDERATTSYGYPYPSSSTSALERIPDRPATAPITLSQLMPPKRELPFPKGAPSFDTEQEVEEVGRGKANRGTNPQTTTKAAKDLSKGKPKGQTSRPSSSKAKPRPASRKVPAEEVQRLPAPGQELDPEGLVTPETLVGDNLPWKPIATGMSVTETAKAKSKAEIARPSSSKGKPRPASKQRLVKEQQVHPASARQLRSQDRVHANTLDNDKSPEGVPTTILNAESGPSRKRNPAKENPQPLPLGSEPGPEEQATSEAGAASGPANKGTAKRAMTEASPSKTNTRKKIAAAAEMPPTVPRQFTKDFENVPPEEYMDRLDHWVRKYQDLPAPKPTVKPSTDKEQLAAYVAQPEPERLAALDSMICDYLDDENFVKLVEDMDKSWRRIGLGF
ncbi:MAG: hypothetical protein Q9208_003605 [Pyrenodesmia sp. 3 TL-2023]